jgi:hypothetical protein
MLHGHPLCPYDALSRVLAIPGGPLDPLFCFSDHCKTILLWQSRSEIDINFNNSSGVVGALESWLVPSYFLVKGSVDSDFNLRRVDVLPCSWGMFVTLKVTKTLQFRSKPIETRPGGSTPSKRMSPVILWIIAKTLQERSKTFEKHCIGQTAMIRQTK